MLGAGLTLFVYCHGWSRCRLRGHFESWRSFRQCRLHGSGLRPVRRVRRFSRASGIVNLGEEHPDRMPRRPKNAPTASVASLWSYLARQLERPRPSWSDAGVPTPAGGRWHATQVIRVRERLVAAA
jgi:hypothetical protein